jgi:hypothetical protein
LDRRLDRLEKKEREMKKCPSCGLEKEEVAALRERLKEAEALIGTIPGHTNIPEILKKDAQTFLDKAEETKKLKKAKAEGET